MKKLSLCIITGCISFTTISISYHDYALIKKRNSQEQQIREYRRILTIIGASPSTDAFAKIEGIQTLLDQLHAESVTQALETLGDLRTEMKSILTNLEEKHKNNVEQITQEYCQKIEILENSHQSSASLIENKYASDMQKMLSALNAPSVDAALNKINQLQLSNNTIMQLAKIIEKPENH